MVPEALAARVSDVYWAGFASGGLLGLAVGAAVMLSAVAVIAMVINFRREGDHE